MLIHHFYPKTTNIGDHFVQRGVERLFNCLVPDATSKLFNVNDRGDDKIDFGLTHRATDRANQEADLVVIGGSNLYEGRNGWGVHIEPGAIEKLRVPLILLGIGTGSNFLSRLPRPSGPVLREIRALNDASVLSGARDVVTLRWLHGHGITKAKLAGDPATFIFNRSFQPPGLSGHLLVAIPPVRYWARTSRREYLDPRRRAVFKALAKTVCGMAADSQRILVACNDKDDQELARSLFAGKVADLVCPATVDEYFKLFSDARAVISGRLHTAVVSFSLGIPFVLLDLDQRTHGFIETYGLEGWAVQPGLTGTEARLGRALRRLLSNDCAGEWDELVARRNAMYRQATSLLETALARVIHRS